MKLKYIFCIIFLPEMLLGAAKTFEETAPCEEINFW
jgi:hypothetical protein